MITKKLLCVLLIIGLFAIFLLSPAISAELPAIKIGMSYDFSGPNAEPGKMEYDTAMLAIEETNAKGGIKGHKIVTIPLDDASDPARAVSNAKRLIEMEKVRVIVGSSTSSSSLGLMKVAEPAKVPVFGNLTASSACYAYRYYFSQPIDRADIEAITSRISADGHKRLAHLYINIAWGVGNIQLVKEFGSRFGLQVVSQEALDPSATDHSVLLTKVRGTKPDAVFPTTLGASAAVLARGFESIGWHPTLYYTELFPKIASKILGGWELFEGAKLARQYDTRNPLCSEVFEKYKKRYGTYKEDCYILAGWDSAQTAIEAIRTAKDPESGESIRDAAEIIDILSATGRVGTRIKYTPDRHWFLGVDSYTFVQVKGGKLIYMD